MVGSCLHRVDASVNARTDMKARHIDVVIRPIEMTI